MPGVRGAHALAVVAAGLALAPAALGQTFSGRVTRVVDGDTVQVRVGGVDATVQLLGLDAPEATRPGAPGQCGGREAAAAARRLLPAGSAVSLATDPTVEAHDRRGRLLAYVHRGGGTSPWTSVNYRLVAGGRARISADGGRPFAFAVEYLCAQVSARHLHRGIWGSPCRPLSAP
jgi:micrococcal nuclease